jgi:hypothetical protein
MDVSGLIRNYFEPQRLESGLTLDYEADTSFYTVVEGGMLITDRNEETHHYKSNGYYCKVGFDRNLLEPKPSTLYDMLYYGFRFGVSKFEHRADDIIISDDYWGNRDEKLAGKTLQAFWVEGVFGVNTEVFRNVFLGWSFRGQILLRQDKDPRMNTWVIPGYGKAGKKHSFYVTYTISYRIPILKARQ